MQKYLMFEDLNVDLIMYPSGTMKDKAGVIADYPILGTKYGVIGVNTEDDGVIEDIAFMFFYANIITFASQYKDVIDFTGMTNAEKCEAITAYVNQPKSDAEPIE